MRRGLAYLLVVLLGAAAGLLALGTVTVAQGPVGPGRVAVRAHLGDSRTELRLPPLGQISAATHFAPVTLTAQVDEVSLDRLQDLLKTDDPGDRLRSEVSADLEPLLRAFAWRALLTALVAGALAGALVPRRRWTHALAGAGGAVVAITLLLGGAWRGYDAEAFEKARFEGPLERAPALLATVRKHVDDIDVVRKRVRVLGDQVAELYSVASSQVGGPVAGDEVRILHISDIHSNPLGLEVARRLAEHFKVEAILDTGDLTSFGLPARRAPRRDGRHDEVPYLLVPGNHDSPENRQALAAVHNIQLLDGTVAEVGGVRILGIGDPAFTATNETSTAEAAAIKRAAGARRRRPGPGPPPRRAGRPRSPARRGVRRATCRSSSPATPTRTPPPAGTARSSSPSARPAPPASAHSPSTRAAPTKPSCSTSSAETSSPSTASTSTASAAPSGSSARSSPRPANVGPRKAGCH